MEKIIVAAKSTNNVIGLNDDLAWSMPADLEHYHNMVRGHWAIVGRTTYESTYEPVPVERMIIITRNSSYTPKDKNDVAVLSINAALDYAQKHGKDKVFILGGGNIYQQFMNIADEMVITEVKTVVDGDTFFPEIDFDIWKEVRREQHLADAANPFDYNFVFYERMA